jgi:hypothetical protein
MKNMTGAKNQLICQFMLHRPLNSRGASVVDAKVSGRIRVHEWCSNHGLRKISSTGVVFQRWSQEELEYTCGVLTMVSGRTRVHEWCSNDGLRKSSSTRVVFHVTSVPLFNFIFRYKSGFLNIFVKLFQDETK